MSDNVSVRSVPQTAYVETRATQATNRGVTIDADAIKIREGGVQGVNARLLRDAIEDALTVAGYDVDKSYREVGGEERGNRDENTVWSRTNMIDIEGSATRQHYVRGRILSGSGQVEIRVYTRLPSERSGTARVELPQKVLDDIVSAITSSP